MIRASRVIELADAPGIETVFDAVRRIHPDVVILVGMPLDARAAGRARDLANDRRR